MGQRITHFDINKMKTVYQNLWDTAKVVISGKF